MPRSDQRPDAVAGLPTFDHALLWCVRAWAVGRCRGVAVSGQIAAVFADLGAPRALGYFEGLMWALNNGAVRMIDVQCVCGGGLTDDEAALLDALALAGEPGPEASVDRFATMTTPGAARACHDSASRMLAVLAAAGHAMSRAAGPAHPRIPASHPSWHGPRASDTLH